MGEICPNCGKPLGWYGDTFEWFCNGCGDVFTDDELDEARQEADHPE